MRWTGHSHCFEKRYSIWRPTPIIKQKKLIVSVDTGRCAAVSKSGVSDGPTAATGIGLHANDFIMRMTACLLAPLPWFEVATLQRFMGSIQSLPTVTAGRGRCCYPHPSADTHMLDDTLVSFLCLSLTVTHFTNMLIVQWQWTQVCGSFILTHSLFPQHPLPEESFIAQRSLFIYGLLMVLKNCQTYQGILFYLILFYLLYLFCLFIYLLIQALRGINKQ